MTRPDALKLLDSVPLFVGLTSGDRKLLSPLCRARAYEKGEKVFSEGEPAKELCFVVLGRLKVVKSVPGRELILGLFGPGEPVGMVAVFEGRPYPASAIALEPSTVVHVPEHEFFSVLGDHAGLVKRLFQRLMTRQEIADLAATTVETAIRVMSRWGKDGLVETREDGFFVPDAEGLKKHAAAN